jgi:hypothetical protein
VQFDFRLGTDEQPVMTGHDEGLITLNVAEADAAFRENMREKLGEGYRTLLGHLRHEIGHYYWNVLVRDKPPLKACRALFGEGAPPNWAESFISAYATMHPWEDWAETWAHYLHMVDTLETAKSHGLTIRTLGKKAGKKVATESLAFQDYESLSTSWQSVTLALNDLNRSMGVKDAYPFILTPAVHAKLQFVHDLIHSAQRHERERPRARPSAPVKANAAGWRKWLARGRASA